MATLTRDTSFKEALQSAEQLIEETKEEESPHVLRGKWEEGKRLFEGVHTEDWHQHAIQNATNTLKMRFLRSLVRKTREAKDKEHLVQLEELAKASNAFPEDHEIFKQIAEKKTRL